MNDASRSASPPFHVVGIGASAGGLEALERFFAGAPSNCDMAFVVVQHLSPDFKSLMDELLARRTTLPIKLVTDGMLIEPNHVYLIPPKKEMIVSNGRLLLSEREPRQQELTMPIDVFFRSLAQDCGSRAIAIVLSGGGTDGSRGIRDVHDAGGLVLVQDEVTAQFDGMPKTARDAGVAHWVLAPEDMPAVLLQHARSPGTIPASQEPRATHGLGLVYQMLEDEFGLDFKDYKPSTVTRRIERRLALSRVEDIDHYIERLRNERSELDVLYRDLLIGVTRFFRNEEAFAVLEQRIVGDLFDRLSGDAPLRLWVAGCATGEEAYSLAILLHETAQRHGNRAVKIFATDVHRGSLEVAARGIYDEEAIANVSEERLERYFVRHGDGYQVVPEIRQMLVFAGHNVVKDPPFTRVDLVSCRNLLIYLQPAAQQKVLTLFHFALNRGGVLVLGPSESPSTLSHDFETLDAHWRIYRKHSDVRIPVDRRLQPGRFGEPRALSAPGILRPSAAQLLDAYDALLDEFMPPSLLLNDRGELLHAFAGASRFLRNRDGRQTLEVLDLVDAELKMVLVGGLKRAATEVRTISFTGVRITVEGEERTYRVSVKPTHTRSGRASNLLVSFDAMEPDPRTTERHQEIDIGNVPHEQVAALEAELNYTRENLQAAIEELETSNEELQASNEELIASNEELQSTNEELQSVNEELYTVNAEYQRKIDELTELTNDMDNLLSSTDVGTIFLDAQLRVRKITPQISELFSLLPQDLGRPIEAFTHTIDHPGLMDDLRNVLQSQERIEREIRDRRGGTFFLRILPYRAKGRVDGVVLTLIDVTGLKAAEDALFHERYLLESLLDNVRDGIYFRDVRGRFIRVNQAMAERLGAGSPRELVGKTPFETCDHQTAIALHEKDERVLHSGEPLHYAFDMDLASDGRERWDVSSRLPMADRSGRIVGVIGILRDVTEQKRAEHEIADAVRRRDHFLAMLSHELRNPLGAIVMATAMLRDGITETDARTRMLETLERQSQQMSRLLDDLLEASRVTQDKIELRRSVVDFSAVAREAADAVRNLMDTRGLCFTVQIEDVPLLVEGDPARLQQIQVNMLSNATKYTPHGGHVWLEVAREDDHVRIVVRDDGVGIPPDMLDKVFDLFVQSNRTLDRADGGLGLGLTLVRSLVQMHGGTVSAHSEGEGKGSEFIVRLPLATRDAIAAPTPAPRPILSRGSRIVLIEDNEDSRELLCQFLTTSGYECQAAPDGPTGLALIERFRPSIAIIDVGLPGIDGFEVARRVRDGEQPGVYLVALTGYGQPTDRERAIAAGFDEHIVKPVQPTELMHLLARGDGDPPS